MLRRCRLDSRKQSSWIGIRNPRLDGKNHGSPYETQYGKTQVHELGYLTGAGRNDNNRADLPWEEVYSGDPDDPTPETVNLKSKKSQVWSVMSNGWDADVNEQPMGGEYIAYSLEELYTIEFKSVDSKGNGQPITFVINESYL